MAYEGQPGKAFVDTQLVQDHIGYATQYVAQSAADRFVQGSQGALKHMPSLRFDSPLEVIFWVWWEAITLNAYEGDYLALSGQREVSVNGKDYRVDFLVEPCNLQRASNPAWKPIAVELDGHAFHERTREQVALRDSRDRALQSAGWRVFHFSFAEFTHHPADCVSEVFLFAREQLREGYR